MQKEGERKMEHWKKINVNFDMMDDVSHILPLFEGENFMLSSVVCPDCRCAMSATLFPNGYWINTEHGEKVQLKGANICSSCYTIYGAGKSQDGKWEFFKLNPDYEDFFNRYIPEMNYIGCTMDEKNSAHSFFNCIQQNF